MFSFTFEHLFLTSPLSFTIHGFRYLSVFRSPNALTLDDVECPFVHSETTLKGHFATSNPIVNQIQHNIQWGQLSNLMSVPTDWSVIFIYLLLASFPLYSFVVHNVMNDEDGWVMQHYQLMKHCTILI
jgi:hypothetical protein